MLKMQCLLILLAYLNLISSFYVSLRGPNSINNLTLRGYNNQISMNSESQLGRVTMYRKLTCPFCIKATSILEEKHGLLVNYVNVEESDSTKRDDILQQMRTFSGGRNTVPQIFFNAEHVGGCDDLEKIDNSGELLNKITYIKSTPVTMMMDHWYHPWY